MMEIKIKLKIKDVKIELNRKEIEELKDILETITGKTVVEKVIERERFPWAWPYLKWDYDTVKWEKSYEPIVITYTGANT